MIRRKFVDGRWGQLHLRENAPVAGTPLVCLHATAYSSRTFVPLLEELDGARHALALDTPGYGDSDPPPAPPSIEDYADVIAAALPGRIDLFGYHTGVSIAVEIALRHPAKVRRLALMGIPHFRALDFDEWRVKLAARHELDDALDQFAERWDFLVANRPDELPLATGFANFVDELKAWPNGWWAHEALFAHDLAARLPLLTQPVTVLNPAGHLAEASRLAAALIGDVEVIELPDANGAALHEHAAEIAALIERDSGAAIPSAAE